MKAYRRDSDIIAYDEPTAPLSEKEIDLMFKVIEKQKAAGKAIIYVSHRMNEIFQITDEIVVLKDGRVTASGPREEILPTLIGTQAAVRECRKNVVKKDEVGVC